MSVYKRKGTWVVQIGSRGGRQRVAVGPNKAEAQAVEARMKAVLRAGKFPELKRVKPILFRDHAKEVLSVHYSAKRSHDWAKLIIKNRLNPFFGVLFIGAITPKTISDHMARRRAEGVANGTVNNERAVLSKIMSLAVRWGHRADNPVVRVEKYETPKGRDRLLSHAEADKLIEKSAKHLKAIIICGLETGGRISEILGLKWADIDFDGGLLYFLQQNTKAAKQREIPLTPTLTAALRSIPRAFSTDHVFTYRGKALVDVKEGFKAARDRAGLGKDVTIHTLRHTWASWASMSGMSTTLLMDLGGWSSEAMVRRYRHLNPAYRRSAVPMMGRAGKVPDDQVQMCPQMQRPGNGELVTR